MANRRQLDETLTAEISRAQRTNATVSFVLLDLDHFKQLNDTHGHLAGDAVLVEAARRLSARARGSDLVARYGGEEFAVILADLDSDLELARTAEALRMAIAEDPFTIHDQVTPSNRERRRRACPGGRAKRADRSRRRSALPGKEAGSRSDDHGRRSRWRLMRAGLLDANQREADHRGSRADRGRRSRWSSSSGGGARRALAAAHKRRHGNRPRCGLFPSNSSEPTTAATPE